MTDSHANFTYRGHTTEWNNRSTLQGVTVQNDVTAQYQSYWGTPFSVLDDSVKPFMFKPNVINMFAYYRHCAWQLQWLNWWVFHNDVNAPLVLLHKSDNIKVYQEDDGKVPKDNITVELTAVSSSHCSPQQSEEGSFGLLTSEYTRVFC